ncbi:TetR/AcrR family transcriptional regulator [Martelella soudanensis]|uniref:TetR/AcrR family transcriptional regulator n=1 Tax=unclassified Martelella TaxID=2629616 RepID=UPI0015DDA158|nr:MULTISPECIES: TetR/AcrR family transcriptional regulator [unclassified Martelella]
MSRTERSRRQIFDSAVIEFEAAGVEATSMEKIARRAGLTRATLYNLFSGKEEIAEIIVGEKIGVWDAEIRQRLTEGSDPLELIVEALQRNAETCLAYPRIAVSVLTSPQRHAPSESRGRYPSFRHLIVDLMKAAQAERRLRTDLPPETLMFIVMGLYVQFMIHQIVKGGPMPPEAIPKLVRTTCEGIGPQERA